jgi:alpha-L-arabinofuranosidase
VAVRRPCRPQLETLEHRNLLSSVTVNAGQVLRPVDNQVLGTNLAWWDSNLNTSQTQQMVQAAGLNMFRFPGGSSSDTFHFNATPTYNGEGTAPSMASFISSVNGTGMVTLDYGSGSPQEAAAFLAYLNAPTSNTTAIGQGEQWNTATNSWTQVDWKTAGYWAGLRAATPLAQDDGLNFLRVGRAAPFGVRYFEVGNEVYGGWETDHHGQGGDTGAPHDPATYVAFAKQFAGYAAQIDPTISIGVDTGSVSYDNNWTANVLTQCASQGWTPGFLSDHLYMQGPGSESDSYLLHTVTDTSQDTNSPHDWVLRASEYRNLLQQKLGAAGNNVELLATEFNSVWSNPGKQSTSLVNGLFAADSLGRILQSGYDGALVWDLRNGWSTGNNNSSSLYGWRQGGDYGLLGDGSGPAPSTGTYIPYPTYFAEQLLSQMVHTGDSVVQSSSSDANLSVYAVQEADGHLDLLVINKDPATDLTGQFQVSGFQPASQAQVWQYGKTQDTAQSQTTDGHSALANFTTTLTLTGSSFSYTFPSYSMTVLDLAPASQPPTVAVPASASPNPVTGKTTNLSVLGADAGGESKLTYTWAATGTPPAPVTFSANGTNAAKNTTATFGALGTYSLQVTIADPATGLSTTSSVTVTVSPTLTSIVVTPATATVATNATGQFSATGYDQFGAVLGVQPAFNWAVTSGGGNVGTTGLFTAPAGAGTSVVTASSDGVSASATVTVKLAPPGAPTGLSASVRNRRVTLTWTDEADNETGFYVQMSLDGVHWKRVATLGPGAGPGTTDSVTSGTMASGTYYARVVAYNPAGSSAPSNVVTFTV